MGTVMVTGAQGFIGRHVSRHYFRKNWSVVGIGHGNWSVDEQRTWGVEEWISKDITTRNLEDLRSKPDHIIHCAGSGSVAFSFSNPAEDFCRNVQTTASVLEFARIAAPQAKIVILSSAAVYGDVESVPIRETQPLHPVSPYGLHKKMAEELSQNYAVNFGIAVSIVRLFSVFGLGLKKQLWWEACKKITNNDCRFSGTGEEVRDWIHVDDASALLFHAAEHASMSCLVVNGGSGMGMTIKDIVKILHEGLDGASELSFSGLKRKGDPERYVSDSTKASELGWRPKKQLSDGIREYVDWYRSDYL